MKYIKKYCKLVHKLSWLYAQALLMAQRHTSVYMKSRTQVDKDRNMFVLSVISSQSEGNLFLAES